MRLIIRFSFRVEKKKTKTKATCYLTAFSLRSLASFYLDIGSRVSALVRTISSAGFPRIISLAEIPSSVKIVIGSERSRFTYSIVRFLPGTLCRRLERRRIRRDERNRKREEDREREGRKDGGKGREEKRREKRDRDRIVRRGKKKNHRDLRIADYGEQRARSRLRGINTSRVSKRSV